MSDRPRLLILSFSDISADARVLKQVRLFADSYDVTTCGYGESPDERVVHLELPASETIDRRDRNDMILRRYRKMYWNLPGIRAAKTALARSERFDVILADDIDTVGLALSLEPRGGVHADIHEYAPRQNDEMVLWRVFVAPYVRWMCRTFLRRASSMTTVGGGVAREYRRVFGVDARIVTNAAPYAALAPSPTASPVRIVHSGAALRNRRLEVMVDAVVASNADVRLDLYLMPNDPAYIEELRRRAGPDERVTVRDPVPYRELIATLNNYDVGIHVIPPTNFNNRWSLPNKFFDYVQARLALVIGPSAEMRDVLQTYAFGAVAAGFDVEAVRKVIDDLTPERVAEWKRAADRAARPLSAEEQVRTWSHAIDALADRARP